MIFTWKSYFMAVQHSHTCTFRPAVCGILLVLIPFPNMIMMSHATESGEFLTEEDSLTPYITHHGPLHRSHRDTQACQSLKYGNVTHSKSPAHVDTVMTLPLVETHFLIKEVGDYWQKRLLYVNHQVVNNPLTTWSVLEPNHSGTCQNGTSERATVQVSALQKHCLVAANAGFFNTRTGQCLGNIVSDGYLIQDSDGIQNAHFGITKDGFIYTGYLSELDLLVQDFTQLVGGVVWLVRDGKNYVDESKAIECPDTENTGTVERFITVASARTAVGHDNQGRVHMVQVNGKTDVSGLDLYKFADLLIELGVVNAINLDGGGSATTVINGTVVNYPSDQCTNSSYNCPREVSTILCVHHSICSLPDCSGHGSCEMGVCHCQGHWAGQSCERLECPNDCTWHGRCTEDGCQCHPGWKGGNCSLGCDKGWYGTNCSLTCTCEAGATCNSVTGVCKCPPGYTGKYCQSACPVGYFGQDCHEMCSCNDSCLCDTVTGNCNITNKESEIFTVSMCLAKQEIKRRHLVPDNGGHYSFCMASLLGVSIVTTVSLFVNVLLLFLLVKTRQNQEKRLKRSVRLAVKDAMWRMMSVQPESDSDDEAEDVFDNKNNKKIEKPQTVPNEEENLTGSGEEEEDLFLAPKRVNVRVT